MQYPKWIKIKRKNGGHKVCPSKNKNIKANMNLKIVSHTSRAKSSEQTTLRN